MDKALPDQSPWVKYDGSVSSLESLTEFSILPGRLIDKWEAQGITRITFGEKAELSGFLARIKTYDRNGHAIFPFFLQTDNKLIVLPAVDFDPGDTNELIEGVEVQLIGGENDAVDNKSPLEEFNGKKVRIKSSLSSGLELYCHPFGLYLSDLEEITAID